MLLELTPSEALTSHPPTIIDGSDEKIGEEAVDITVGEEWVVRVEVARNVVEILDRRVNASDSKFKTPEDFTVEEN